MRTPSRPRIPSVHACALLLGATLLLGACSPAGGLDDGELTSSGPVTDDLGPVAELDDYPEGWEFDRAVPVDGQSLSSVTHSLSTIVIPGQFAVGSIWVEANQAREYFVYQTPLNPPAGPAPLLVVFHGWGASHADVVFFTDFLTEARNRGWYVLAPLGRWEGAPGNGTKNFGALQAQESTSVALEWMCASPLIDPTQVYGAGFSMGGGWMMSYAARHPGTFTALVNHTGGVSLMDTFWNDPVAAQDLMTIHGATPAADPFAYERTSTIVLDMSGQLVSSGAHMAVNLEETPIQTWYSINDTGLTSYLVDQSLQLDAYFALPPNTMNHTLVPRNYTGMPAHSWSALDFTAVCDWFALQPPLSGPPTQGHILQDRAGTFGLIDILQDNTGFTDIAYGAFANNHYAIVATNLQAFETDMLENNLDPTQPWTVFMDTTDGVDFTFRNARQPVSVTRNGVPTSDWTFTFARLTLHDTIGGPATWAVQ